MPTPAAIKTKYNAHSPVVSTYVTKATKATRARTRAATSIGSSSLGSKRSDGHNHSAWILGVVATMMIEVPRVLFLGICLDFYYSLLRGLLPKFGFHLGWGVGIPGFGGALPRSTMTPTRTWRFPLRQRRPTCGYGLACSCEGPLTFSAGALL